MTKGKTSKAVASAEGPKAISFVGKNPRKAAGPEVNMACQRGKDLKTKGQHCDSKRAYNMSGTPGGSSPSFQCTKCGFQWTVQMGGSFNT